jgi:hypothetical protein
MATNLSIKLDVLKIDKAKLFKGDKGTYLDATVIMKDEPDQFGNVGMVVQNTTKEDRDAGVKGAILGNVKYIAKAATPAKKEVEIVNDLPF